jgi:hypothetical protein
MTKGPSRQRCVRFGAELEQKVTELAEREELPFSLMVKRLVRQGLRQVERTQQPQHAA